jgi:4a-hydroxytetrahydrobiopterin dehydratase
MGVKALPSYDETRRKVLHALPRRCGAAYGSTGRGVAGAGTRVGAHGRCTPDRAHFRLRDFREALTFVQKVGELAESEGHHPDISFGWGYATLSLRTKKIKGLHENDFIMAAKIDRLAPKG